MNTHALTSGRNDVTFKSMNYNLAAHLYIPEKFDVAGGYPAVIFSQPFNQVKEHKGTDRRGLCSPTHRARLCQHRL